MRARVCVCVCVCVLPNTTGDMIQSVLCSVCIIVCLCARARVFMHVCIHSSNGVFYRIIYSPQMVDEVAGSRCVHTSL